MTGSVDEALLALELAANSWEDAHSKDMAWPELCEAVENLRAVRRAEGEILEPPAGSRVIDGLGRVWERDSDDHWGSNWRLYKPQEIEDQESESWIRVCEQRPIEQI